MFERKGQNPFLNASNDMLRFIFGCLLLERDYRLNTCIRMTICLAFISFFFVGAVILHFLIPKYAVHCSF